MSPISLAFEIGAVTSSDRNIEEEDENEEGNLSSDEKADYVAK
jgi:hypothetical protein